MNNLKKNLRILVLPLLALFFIALPMSQASAHLESFDLRSTEIIESNLSQQIIIIIFFKAKKKGIVEATSLKLGTKDSKLPKNAIRAEATAENGVLQLRVKGFNIGMPPTVMLVPEGFLMPKQAALKMGYKAGAFKLKAGRLKLEPNALGNFEIQDL
ncbi:MAG: hypothetical protein AAF927_14840 [Bacteroidota bacterium]